MTMFFGMALPILYPIALVALIIFYHVDIYMLHRCYRMPPTFDEVLNQGTLDMLTRSSILCNIMSIWQINNNCLKEKDLSKL
jgi:hypothetical protein